ncbi:MAG: nitroreductase family protein [Prevotella sp.]|nr:nitroreductase family protein [Prevotella sp.]
MEDFKSLVQRRRSHRRFTDEEVSAEDLQLILRAALMSPTSKGQRNWQFAVVDNKRDIEKLSDAKDMGSQFMKGAPLAIVVMGDPKVNDCWIEDCSIAAISMQYQCEDLGLGSCWIQMRARGLSDGHTANEVIHGILGLPDHLEVLCVLAIGHAADERKLQSEDDLKWENVIIKADD